MEEIPIYGDGKQIRDWLYVDDHCDALNLILKRGRLGQTYNIGGMNEKTNLDVVSTICDKLDIIYPNKKIKSYRNLITFIKDRPGHDRRYSINPKKISNELNWIPKETFDSGIDKTLDWYLLNQNWVNNIISGEYVNWLKKKLQMKIAIFGSNGQIGSALISSLSAYKPIPITRADCDLINLNLIKKIIDKIPGSNY